MLICELGSNKASGLQFFSDVNEILIVPCKVWINFGTNVLKDSLSYGDSSENPKIESLTSLTISVEENPT